MIDLDELMRLHATATPGPWKTDLGNFDSDGYSMVIRPYIEADGKIICVSNDDTDYGYDEDDAAYICAACNAVPELVQQIRDLEARAEFWQKVADKMSMGNVCFDCTLPKLKNCPLRRWPYTTYDKPASREEVAECRMQKVRLAVEAEMLQDGKGPGRKEKA